MGTVAVRSFHRGDTAEAIAARLGVLLVRERVPEVFFDARRVIVPLDATVDDLALGLAGAALSLCRASWTPKTHRELADRIKLALAA